ncbi:hypothetical protein MARINOS108_20467 [Marinoscillum sp. 108]|nr:hypothetical protein MARINOS108_20467 [Marinoscillum sp. 108]
MFFCDYDSKIKKLLTFLQYFAYFLLITQSHKRFVRNYPKRHHQIV